VKPRLMLLYARMELCSHDNEIPPVSYFSLL
jgi:hypothetical protein